MPAARRQYEIVSVSLPRELVKRANAVIPKARRSRVITSMLTAFLDSVARKQLERDYAVYYGRRSAREEKEERDLLVDWQLSDADA
jgi:metal-responsive CopG/Arc/MetJ family transcriptional regulator